jgi:hypothetical protein
MTATLKRLKEAVEGIASGETKETQTTGSDVKPSQGQVSLEEFLGEFKESVLADFKKKLAEKKLAQQESPSSTTSSKKEIAHELALAWWKEAKEHGRTSAICDSCNSGISEGQGYVCKPGVVSHPMFSSPDLVCESCFDRKSYEPWKIPTSSIEPSVRTEKEQEKATSPNVAATQKDIAWQTIEQNQKCEKCFINSGHPFTFYYGNYGKTIIETVTTYHVGGAQQVIICAECIKQQADKKTRNKLRESLIVAAFVAGLIFLIIELPELEWGLGILFFFAMMSFFFNVVPGIFSVLRYYLSSERYREKESLEHEIGNKIAISLREKTLKDQGFDQTWTPKTYKFLRSG